MSIEYFRNNIAYISVEYTLGAGNAWKELCVNLSAQNHYSWPFYFHKTYAVGVEKTMRGMTIYWMEMVVR